MNRKTVFVCMACGKQSNDRYGKNPISAGWDESCVLNAQEVYLDALRFSHNRVNYIEPGGFVEDPVD